MPTWLKGDFSAYAHPALLENYSNRLKSRYHYQTRQYATLLAFTESGRKYAGVLIGKIGLYVLEALSFYKSKRRKEAIAALSEAYRLAEPNGLVTSFIIFGKDMRTLTAAAIKDDSCTIPRTWLENINRKSSAYAKKQAHMISQYQTANDLNEKIHLTERETDILKDLAQGLSRTEIAASQNISPNTVKVAVNIIYEKLHANSLVDAVRIAVIHQIL
jgi:LuxR family maltose regulon positive regulatory protein